MNPIAPTSPIFPITSRLGRVGSIQAWDPWLSRLSVDHAKFWCAKIASISFGNDAPKRDHNDVFADLIRKGHMAILEHVPFPLPDTGPMDSRNATQLPRASLRHHRQYLEPAYADNPLIWGKAAMEVGKIQAPATTFLIECPLYTRSQWHRHRSAAYNEMSRRWTKGAKVPLTFYGEQWFNEDGTHADPERLVYWKMVLAEYERRLDRGESQETARGCMPMEAHTRFWASAYDRDWISYLSLRDESHAQAEIQVFARQIHLHLSGKYA